jgi:hypothetical protein
MLSHTDEENDEDANVEMNVEMNSDDEADDFEKGTVEQDENEPRFDSILSFFIKIIHAINTLTSTMHYAVNIWRTR